MNATLGATITCPKCAGEMRSYERAGVIVDQCRECRGIFLDRGELERLIDLESSLAEPAPAAARPRTAPADDWPGQGRSQGVDRDHPDRDHRDRRDRDDRRRREGLDVGDLGELGAIGGLGSLGEIADLGDLFGGRGSRRPADPRQAPTSGSHDPRSGQPPKKRGGLFRELLEGFGE